MNAAFGIPASDFQMSGENLKRWERKEVQSGQTALRAAKIFFLLGLGLVAWATRETIVGQSPAPSFVAIDTVEPGIVCGEFVNGDNSGITLVVDDEFSQQQNVTLQYAEIQELRLLEACPDYRP
jgi:hypothetical protein